MRLTLTFYYLTKNEYKGKKEKRTTLKQLSYTTLGFIMRLQINLF